MQQTLVRLMRYGAIAAIGLAGDIATFSVLLWLGTGPFLANMAGGAVGVTFVYFTSARAVFHYKGRLLLPKLMAYWGYQAASVALFSGLIAWMALATGLSPLVCKVGFIPLQFTLNYLVLGWLLRAMEPPTVPSTNRNS